MAGECLEEEVIGIAKTERERICETQVEAQDITRLGGIGHRVNANGGEGCGRISSALNYYSRLRCFSEAPLACLHGQLDHNSYRDEIV